MMNKIIFYTAASGRSDLNVIDIPLMATGE